MRISILHSFLFISVVLAGYNASAQSAASKLRQLTWMLGTWEMKTAKGSIYETWHITNDSTFQGRSYKVREGQDTLLLETVQITCRDKKFFYTPTVSDQNNQQPVLFTMTTVGDHEFIAENTAHDFPQRIGYKRNEDHLDAWIDGNLKGEYARRNFSFIKIND